MYKAKIKYIIPVFVILFSCRTVNLATLIETRNFDQAKEEIQNGADVNSTLENQLITALHVASRYGYHAIAKSLLENGAHINALDEKKNTPLHLACGPLATKFLLGASAK